MNSISHAAEPLIHCWVSIIFIISYQVMLISLISALHATYFQDCEIFELWQIQTAQVHIKRCASSSHQQGEMFPHTHTRGLETSLLGPSLISAVEISATPSLLITECYSGARLHFTCGTQTFAKPKINNPFIKEIYDDYHQYTIHA